VIATRDRQTRRYSPLFFFWRRQLAADSPAARRKILSRPQQVTFGQIAEIGVIMRSSSGDIRPRFSARILVREIDRQCPESMPVLLAGSFRLMPLVMTGLIKEVGRPPTTNDARATPRRLDRTRYWTFFPSTSVVAPNGPSARPRPRFCPTPPPAHHAQRLRDQRTAPAAQARPAIIFRSGVGQAHRPPLRLAPLRSALTVCLESFFVLTRPKGGAAAPRSQPLLGTDRRRIRRWHGLANARLQCQGPAVPLGGAARPRLKKPTFKIINVGGVALPRKPAFSQSPQTQADVFG